MSKEMIFKSLNNYIILHYFWKYEKSVEEWCKLSDEEKVKWAEHKFKDEVKK